MLCDAVSTRCMMDADKGLFRDWGFMRDKFMESHVREPYTPQA